MSKLDEHAANLRPGLLDEMGRLGREAVADIGNAYQQILMADASVRPPATKTTVEIAQQAGRADIEPVVSPPEPELDR